MTEQEKIDPELADDRNEVGTDVEPVELPEYDPRLFELPDDYEYTEDDDNGSED